MAMWQENVPQGEGDAIDRRDLLRRFGAAGTAVALSGIAGYSDRSEATRGVDQGAPADDTWSVPTPRVPQDVHWNNYNPTSQAGPTRNWVQEYMIGYRQADQTFVPSPVFEDVSVEGQTMTITVREDVTWHSGDPITAEDVVTQVKMDVFMNQPPADVIDTAEAVSDREAEISLTTQNSQIALGTYAGRYFNASSSLYGEFVTQFEEAGSEDERDAVRSDVVEFEAEENGCGPFTITDATARKFEGEVHDGHPAADAIQGVGLEVTKTTGNQGILQMGIADEIDYIGPIVLSADALDQLPDHFQINPTSNLSGHGLFWNHENEHVARTEFRKAIAHVANREQIAQNAAGLQFKTPVDVPTGISGVGNDIPRSWVGDALDDFEGYGMDTSQTEQAAQLLRDAGYSRSDGTWNGPNGNAVQLELVAPGGWTDWVNAFQTLNSQLQDFGIGTEFRTVDAPTWNGQTFPNGEFDVTPRFWGGGRPHPFFGFRKIANSTAQQNANLPQTVEVPMPVGDPDGSMEEINLAEKTAQIPQTSGEEARTHVRELAWAVNQTLPVLPIMEKIGAVWYTTDDWNVPASDDEWMTVNPPTHLTWPFHEGRVTPNRE